MNPDRKAQLEQWRQQKKVQPIQKQPSSSFPRQPAKPSNPQVQLRQQLNQTNGGFIAKTQSTTFKQPMTTTQTNTPLAQNVFTANRLNIVKSRIECEIDVIFSHYRKMMEMIDKNIPQHIRNAHDPDKWRKKFFIVFNREKIIDFTGNSSFPIEQKNLQIFPNGITKEGKKILVSNAKFWILYLRLIQDKITDANRSQMRENILKLFKGSQDFNMINQELGQLLSLQDLTDKENEMPLPHFGQDQFLEEQKEECDIEIVEVVQQESNQNYKNNEPLVSFSNPQNNNDATITIIDQQEEDVQCQQVQNPIINVIPPPSQEYLCQPPIQISHLSIMETPHFKQDKLNKSTQEEEEDSNQQQQQQQEIELNNSIANLTFNALPNLNKEEETQQIQEQEIHEEDKNQKDLNNNVTFAVQPNVVSEQVSIVEEPDLIEDVDQNQDNEMEIEQQNEIQQDIFVNDIQEDVQNEIIQTNEKEIENEDQSEPEEFLEQPIQEVQNLEQEYIMQREESKEEEDEQLMRSKCARPSKKRKRSISDTLTPTSMTLRSKLKKRKLNEDIVKQQEGASYLRYEILEKREGKFLVPVRYSIRNQEQDTPDQQLQRQILNNEVSFIYEPNEMEELFAMDKTTQEIQKLLKQKIEEVEKCDIQEVVDADVSMKGNFSLIKIKPECREKYGGHEQIAAALRRLSTSPGKRDGYMRDMMDHLFQEKKMRDIMLANVSQDALDFIKKSSK